MKISYIKINAIQKNNVMTHGTVSLDVDWHNWILKDFVFYPHFRMSVSSVEKEMLFWWNQLFNCNIRKSEKATKNMFISLEII